MILPDQSGICQHCERSMLYLLTREFTLYCDHRSVLNHFNNPNWKWYYKWNPWSFICKAVTSILKYIKSEQNVGDSSSRRPYKHLLKVKELTHYFNYVADDAKPNALTICIIKKATKNHTLLHQVTKLAKPSNFHKLNKPLTFLSYTENRNFFKHSFKNDSELSIGDDFVSKFNRIVITSELQNHVIPLTR